MRRALSLVMAFLIGIAFSGCVVTTKNVEVERTDQAIAGNQGFLKGTPKVATKEKKATRQHIDFDVELPQVGQGARVFEVKDTVTKRVAPAREVIAEETEIMEEMPSASQEPEDIEEQVAQPAVQPIAQPVVETPKPLAEEKPAAAKKYIVQKNDTLEKIAARPEIYGDGKKWYSIYKANKDKLKGPDKIYPGQELVIPPIEREGEKVGSK